MTSERTKLRIDVVTIFPGMFRGALDESILARAVEAGLVEIRLHDLRRWAPGRHASVDDAPFGGGAGMVMRPEPFFLAVEELTGHPAGERVEGESVVLLSPAGAPFDQAAARRLAGLSRLVLLCGRYEGVDERVRTHLATEALSLGDFVLSGGEPAALAVTDAVVRLVPGALGNALSSATESHEDGLLEAPHYTRPAEWRGLAVPPVLLSGHHEEVRRHRRRESLLTTARVRPDLLREARRRGQLSRADLALLDEAAAGSEVRSEEVAHEGR